MTLVVVSPLSCVLGLLFANRLHAIVMPESARTGNIACAASGVLGEETATTLNNVVNRALVSAGVQTTLEPRGDTQT
ncbi:hypothetical protein BV898_14958 [Hypsibius exemplaris]|uniref:Uncharacterized protein n=1 Tax=Hypsibius exemplaris TaxID=2072580 RepID=A0A9X6NGX8_HYPEX|nr:hypothetical protein BV898_14958 [Hypsibius exemplaris]